jgi:hypothetical protein
MTHTYSGGCQCGKVRYEVQMDIGGFLRVTARDVDDWARCWHSRRRLSSNFYLATHLPLIAAIFAPVFGSVPIAND